jgi:plasmid stabilization system protein ParE
VSQAYRLTATAQRHIDAIGEFVAIESVDAALKIYDDLEAAFEMLGAMPEMGHSREDLTDRPFKFWSVFSYLIVYAPSTNPPTIVAVVHGARDVRQILKTI